MKHALAFSQTGRRPGILKRKFLIAKSDQLKLVLFLSIIVFVLTTISSVALYYQMGAAINKVMFSMHLKVKTVSEALVALVIKVNVIYIIAVVALSCALVSFLIFRVTSAMRLLHQDLEKVAEMDFRGLGRFKRINAIKKMMESYDEMVLTLKEKFSIIDRGSGKLTDLSTQDEPNIYDMKKEVDKIRKTLKHFG